MIEHIKEKIWHLLKEKEISLVMIYDRSGKILWHKGREIDGPDIFEGYGFCKSYIQKSLENPGRIDIEDVIKSDIADLSKSAETLLVKSVIIQPIGHNLFLYIDSGKREIFSEADRVSFKILGDLLEQIISQLQHAASVKGLTGSSEAIHRIRDIIIKYAVEEEPVLLQGETGVGKNHVAELIHEYSGKKGKFVVVETPNIQDNLFESKLFGHKKGAFTDAKYDKKGLVEEAAGGTLFFDEITEVPMDVQAKLLRFMDTQKYYMLGESQEREANVRIIAATNADLQKAVEHKDFREDLYYRLNVLSIKIPALRERKNDIKNLVKENLHLLRDKELTQDFWEVICDHHYPGNIRELLNLIKRAGITLDSPITGEKMATLIGGDLNKVTPETNMNLGVEKVQKDLDEGYDFWAVIWKPFIEREIDRSTVKGILKDFYEKSSLSFKQMSSKLNIKEEDYRKFMSLMYKYKIDPRK
jgi:DNA-binding NtrC family response regulator